MAKIIKPLKVDLSQESSYIYLKMTEGDDNSRKYQVIFTERGIPVNDLKGNELITLYLAQSGSDEPYASQDCVWIDGYPYITFTANMLQHVGDIDCSFKIFSSSDNSLISTRIFHINTQRSLVNYDGLIKSEDFNTLNNLIKQALMVPELIETFKLSQDEINALIVQINSDITEYQTRFNNFDTEATALIGELRTFLSECQSAESTRISNENARIENEKARQANTATAIKNCETATANTNAAIQNAEEATATTTAAVTEAYTQAAYAKQQADRVDEAIRDLQLQKVTIDGGNMLDAPSTDEPRYDGGIL